MVRWSNSRPLPMFPMVCTQNKLNCVSRYSRFFPTEIKSPKVTTGDYRCQAVNDILTILKEPKRSIPTLSYGSPITNAYIEVVQILKRATAPPLEPPPNTFLRVRVQLPRVEPSPPTYTQPILPTYLQPSVKFVNRPSGQIHHPSKSDFSL